MIYDDVYVSDDGNELPGGAGAGIPVSGNAIHPLGREACGRSGQLWPGGSSAPGGHGSRHVSEVSLQKPFRCLSEAL